MCIFFIACHNLVVNPVERVQVFANTQTLDSFLVYFLSELHNFARLRPYTPAHTHTEGPFVFMAIQFVATFGHLFACPDSLSCRPLELQKHTTQIGCKQWTTNGSENVSETRKYFLLCFPSCLFFCSKKAQIDFCKLI